MTESAPVEIIERVEVTPAGDDEELVTPPETPGKEGEEVPDDTDTTKPDQLVQHTPAPVLPKSKETEPPAPVDGETPRERALRFEIERLKRDNRESRNVELLGTEPAPAPAKKEITPEKAAVLAKYKQEELDSLREVLPVLADELGYVSRDQLGAQTYQQKASDELNTFLEKHAEYLPENDKDNVLWNAFRTSYQKALSPEGLYKQPSNPKEFRNLFEIIHRDIFGVQPAGNLQKVSAAQEKIKVASHAGTSSPTGTQRSTPRASTGLRTDMLKGFSDAEIAELEGPGE